MRWPRMERMRRWHGILKWDNWKARWAHDRGKEHGREQLMIGKNQANREMRQELAQSM